jgi:hypothetical protein
MRTRRLLGAAALTLAAAGLTGCMKMDMQLDLQSDDTVDGTMIIAVSAELAELSGQSPEDLAEQMQSEMVPVDEGEGEWTSKPYDDGEFVGSEITFEGAPLNAMGGESASPESLTIVREGDEFVVSGTLDMTDTTGSAEDPMFEGMMDSFDIRIAVSFPGAVSEHNGELSGNTVTWVPVFGEVLEISARGSAVDGGGGSGLPWLLIAGIVVGLLVILGLIVFFVLRSRKGQPAVATAYADPAMGYPAQPAAPAQPAWTPDAAAPPAPPAETYQAPQATYDQPPAPPAAPPAPPAPEAGPPAPPAQ